jgi:hypothetical protein
VPPLKLSRETDFPEALKKHPGLGAFGIGRELKQIASMLGPDEYLVDIIQGAYANQTAVVLMTTNRVIFLAKGFTSMTVEEFPLDKITSVQYTVGLMLGEIIIFASGNKAEIKSTVKAHTKPFAEHLREVIATKKSSTTDSVAGTANVLAEIEKLVSMKERGFLTEEEFAAAKRKVLGL